MFKNYFKAGIRNLWKNKTYSFLNIFGLAIGIACAGLIFLWVEDEVHFDDFNLNKDRLYFARVNAPMDGWVMTHGSTPGLMAPVMQAEIPGIANTCRTTENETSLLFGVGDKSVYASGKYAESSLFNMFTLPFVQGDAKNAFKQLYSLVITEKTAKKFFGNQKNILGKTVRVDNKQDYVITGVLKDIPQNSSLQFEWVAPFQIWYNQSPWAYVWENNCLSTYVELKPGVRLADINKKLYNFVQKKAPNYSSILWGAWLQTIGPFLIVFFAFSLVFASNAGQTLAGWMVFFGAGVLMTISLIEITFYIAVLFKDPPVGSLFGLNIIYAVQHLYFIIGAPGLFIPLGVVLFGSNVLPKWMTWVAIFMGLLFASLGIVYLFQLTLPLWVTAIAGIQAIWWLTASLYSLYKGIRLKRDA